MCSSDLGRLGERLRVNYQLSGPCDDLWLPEPAPRPQRLDELWQSTCLECFLARPGEESYWEVNLAPSGHWNVYRLEGYRQGLTPETACSRAPRLERQDPWPAVAFQMDLMLPPALAEAPVLEVGVTAVIATRGGAISYWALQHPGEQADFQIGRAHV